MARPVFGRLFAKAEKVRASRDPTRMRGTPAGPALRRSTLVSILSSPLQSPVAARRLFTRSNQVLYLLSAYSGNGPNKPNHRFCYIPITARRTSHVSVAARRS
jgi:hypothetical protein